MEFEIILLFAGIAVITHYINLIKENKEKSKTLKNDKIELSSLRSRNKGLAKLLDEQKKQCQEMQRSLAYYRSQNQELQVKNSVANKEYNELMYAYLVSRQIGEADLANDIEQRIRKDFNTFGQTYGESCGYVATAMAEYYMQGINDTERYLKSTGNQYRSGKIADVRVTTSIIIRTIKKQQYMMEYAIKEICAKYPEVKIQDIWKETEIQKNWGVNWDNVSCSISQEIDDAMSNDSLKKEIAELRKEKDIVQAKFIETTKRMEDMSLLYNGDYSLLHQAVQEYKEEFSSNLSAIPYMSKIIADIMTVDLKKVAWSLSWGNNQERKKKVESINILRKEMQERIEKMKWAEYQLAYLIELYPALQDVIDTEFKELEINFNEIQDTDPTRHFLSSEEWKQLSEAERNQLALDRYIDSRKKSNWQIGRDYELYCGYLYEKQGYKVDYFGVFHGLEDLGRDLIVQKDSEIRIVQCKYWSKVKQIHEKHIMQLYGSVVEYNLEHRTHAKGILITNTMLSEKAKDFAKALDIKFVENRPIGEFPRIKCNIGKDSEGKKTYIYHLPMDMNYDKTKIEFEGEMMATTVEEAEKAGFRRAYKWHGTN